METAEDVLDGAVETAGDALEGLQSLPFVGPVLG